MKIYHKFTILIPALFLSLFCTKLLSQPILTGLSGNPQLIKETQRQALKPKENIEYKNVKLPFFDDFSYESLYPNPVLWLDRQAFVNNTYPINPPSIGVATLDALNEFGEIYAHALTVPFPADTLTSRPIRLDSIFSPNRPIRISDSLYFSFYYQPGGGSYTFPTSELNRIGNNPDHGDYLILEFGYNTGDSVFSGYSYMEVIAAETYQAGDSIPNPFIPGSYYYFTEIVFAESTILMPCDSLFKPLYVWREVWRTDGCKLDDWLAENRLTYFKQVMIPIVNEEYLRDNFQFRFRNYASLEDQNVAGRASNVDQWHIDYVMLNINRRVNDIYPNDIAFVSPTTTVLKNYYAMPWKQFKISDLKNSFHNKLSNLSDETKLAGYRCSVMKNGTDSIGGIPFNAANARPYKEIGLQENDQAVLQHHVNPAISYKNNLTDNADSANFVVTHIYGMVGAGDICTRNDTCVYIQKFHNYYAYDDGSAENGFSLLSTLQQPHAYLALRFNMDHKDTLRAVRIWFNRVLNDASFAPFTLKVWAVGNNGLPGTELYSQEALMPRHESEYFDFTTYFLNNPFEVPASFFVGLYQNHRIELNIGFDRNSDFGENTYTKTSSDWYQNFFKGSPMIRPVMGKMFDTAVPERTEAAQIAVYPNPTKGELRITNSKFTINDVQLFDIMGRSATFRSSSLTSSEVTLDISHLPNGIYFVKILSDDKQVKTVKVIKL